jgi:hypothetical protein
LLDITKESELHVAASVGLPSAKFLLAGKGLYLRGVQTGAVVSFSKTVQFCNSLWSLLQAPVTVSFVAAGTFPE